MVCYGVCDVVVEWVLFDGGNFVNDVMMVGMFDFVGVGVLGFIELWVWVCGILNVEVIGISGLLIMLLLLNVNWLGFVLLCDFVLFDWIVVLGICMLLLVVVL